MNTVYTDYLSNAAKAEYLIKSEDYISTDKYLTEVEKVIVDHMDNKTHGQIIVVDDYYWNARAPWNSDDFNDYNHHLHGIYLEVSNIFSYEIAALIKDKTNGIKELNIVKVTDDKILGDKSLLYIEFVLDNEDIIVNALYPLATQGYTMINDEIERVNYDPSAVYDDPDMFDALKLFGIGKFNK